MPPLALPAVDFHIELLCERRSQSGVLSQPLAGCRSCEQQFLLRVLNLRAEFFPANRLLGERLVLLCGQSAQARHDSRDRFGGAIEFLVSASATRAARLPSTAINEFIVSVAVAAVVSRSCST